MNRREALAFLTTLPLSAKSTAEFKPLSKDMAETGKFIAIQASVFDGYLERSLLPALEQDCPGLKTFLAKELVPMLMEKIIARYPNLRDLVESIPGQAATMTADYKASQQKEEEERTQREATRLAAKEEAEKPRPFILPTKESIERSFREFLVTDLWEFTNALNKARWIWRHAPALIQSAEFPELFRSAFEPWKPRPDLCNYPDSPDQVMFDNDTEPPCSFLSDPTLPTYREDILMLAAEGCFTADLSSEEIAAYLEKIGVSANSIQQPSLNLQHY